MKKINYIDLGLHAGDELFDFVDIFSSHQINAYGFEAHPDLAEKAKERFEKNSNVKVFNLAVSNQKGREKLYLAHENDLEGSSIFKSKNNVDKNTYIEVDSVRLSDWLRENIHDIKGSINVLRMNIEGAELYVMNDLIDSGFSKYFRVYLGSSKNDILKCDEIAMQNDAYQKKLKFSNIKIYPFTKANRGSLTKQELQILVLFGIPPFRLIFRDFKSMLRNVLT